MSTETKRLVRIVALVEIEAGNENDAMTIGGNLARQISGAIPVHYNTRGVEVESVTDVEGGDFQVEKEIDKDTNVNAQRRGASQKEAEDKTLRT